MSTTPNIQLTQIIAESLTIGEQSVWPLTIQALGISMPSEIFVFQVVPATSLVPGDRFQCVASVSELTALPIVAHIKKRDTHRPRHPDDKFDIPYYRSASAEFVCHTLSEAVDIWNLIQADTQRLVDNYNQLQNLQNSNVVLVGPTVLPNITPPVSYAPAFQLNPIGGQLLPQILEPTTNLYYTLNLYNDGGVFTLRVFYTGYPAVATTPSGTAVMSQFRLYPIGNQLVPQLMDPTSGLYYTFGLLNDGGIMTYQVFSTPYPGTPVSLTPGTVYTSNFRLYPIGAVLYPQLLDSTTGLYHTMGIYLDNGVLTLQLSAQGY